MVRCWLVWTEKEDLEMDRLAEIAREKQPELIIVDRMMGADMRTM